MLSNLHLKFLSIKSFQFFIIVLYSNPKSLFGLVNIAWPIVIILSRVYCNFNFFSINLPCSKIKFKNFNWRNICSAQTATKLRIRQQSKIISRFLSRTEFTRFIKLLLQFEVSISSFLSCWKNKRSRKWWKCHNYLQN